jgi:adenylyltransferase/sulfurtransferase
MNLERYRRQILVEEFGEREQRILSKKHVVVIGLGGLGSHSSNILVRAGIGSIEIIDDDPVELTNLHRTSILDEEDIGKPKSKILEEKLKKVNSDVKINGIKRRVTRENIESIMKNSDVV